MTNRIVHAILPVVVIAAMTALCLTGKVSSTTALAVIVSAGSLGGVAIAGSGTTPTK